MEQNPQTFHERVHHGYQTLANTGCEDIVTIEATGSIADVQSRIQWAILERLINIS
jgi:thymidylate kinase